MENTTNKGNSTYVTIVAFHLIFIYFFVLAEMFLRDHFHGSVYYNGLSLTIANHRTVEYANSIPERSRIFFVDIADVDLLQLMVELTLRLTA